MGHISRLHKIYSLPLVAKNDSVLSLLVENHGRINYGKFRDAKVNSYDDMLLNVCMNMRMQYY